MTRYVCKSCGAESPAGIGYADEGQREFPPPAPGCPGPHQDSPLTPILIDALAAVLEIASEHTLSERLNLPALPEGLRTAEFSFGTLGHQDGEPHLYASLWAQEDNGDPEEIATFRLDFTRVI